MMMDSLLFFGPIQCKIPEGLSVLAICSTFEEKADGFKSIEQIIFGFGHAIPNYKFVPKFQSDANLPHEVEYLVQQAVQQLESMCTSSRG